MSLCGGWGTMEAMSDLIQMPHGRVFTAADLETMKPFSVTLRPDQLLV